MVHRKAHHKVQCWIFSRDKSGHERCLILKTNQARGHFWQPVTGTVEENEGFFEAACREPVEETGFTFNTPPVDTGYEFEFSSRFGFTKERVFTLFVDDEPVPRLDPKEHEDYKWLSPAEAVGVLRFPSNIEGLKKSFSLLFGKEFGKES